MEIVIIEIEKKKFSTLYKANNLGWRPSQIAPLFRMASRLSNVSLQKNFGTN